MKNKIKLYFGKSYKTLISVKENFRYYFGIFGEALILLFIYLLPSFVLGMCFLAAYGLYSLLE